MLCFSNTYFSCGRDISVRPSLIIMLVGPLCNLYSRQDLAGGVWSLLTFPSCTVVSQNVELHGRPLNSAWNYYYYYYHLHACLAIGGVAYEHGLLGTFRLRPLCSMW